MEIKRDYYLEQIHLRENNGFVKVITGVRRCSFSWIPTAWNFSAEKNRVGCQCGGSRFFV